MKRILLALVLLFSAHAQSQNYLGVINSNYSGVMGTDLQPASFVDGRFVVDVNLFSGSFNAYQNAMAFDTKDMPKWWLKSFGDTAVFNSWAKPDSTFMDRYLIKLYDENSNKKLGIYNNIQVDLLNFMFHINPKIAIGFSGKFRSITNVDDVDSKLAVLAENGLDYAALWNNPIEEKRLRISSMSWVEYGINYGQVLKDDGQHFLKMGARAKYKPATNSPSTIKVMAVFFIRMFKLTKFWPNEHQSLESKVRRTADVASWLQSLSQWHSQGCAWFWLQAN